MTLFLSADRGFCRLSLSMNGAPSMRPARWTSPQFASNRCRRPMTAESRRFVTSASNVPRGQIFGLLGPNGAGKSTLINILAGLVVKTSGTVNIWGFDIDEHPRNATRSIGVVPQEIIFDPFFTPRETLEFRAGSMECRSAERKTDELLAAMHLTDKAGAYSRTLSGGMKRRLLVAKAMVHRLRSSCSTSRRRALMSLCAASCGIMCAAQCPGRHDRPHDALSRGSRGAVRPYRDHPPWPGDRERADA